MPARTSLTAALALVLALASSCGSVDAGGADAPPGGGVADARPDSAGGTADALSPSTPFESLSDAELTSVCVQVRDPGCDFFGGDACPPVCDPCADPGIVAALRAVCPDNTTVGDVTNCIATFATPLEGEPQFCDGPATCVIDAMVQVCQ